MADQHQAEQAEKRRRANEAKSAGGKKGGAIAGRGRPKAPASREAEPFLEGLMPEQKRNVVLEVQHGARVRGDDSAKVVARATDLARDYLAENQAKTATAIAREAGCGRATVEREILAAAPTPLKPPCTCGRPKSATARRCQRCAVVDRRKRKGGGRG